METSITGDKAEQEQPPKVHPMVLPKFVSNALYIVDLDPTFDTEGLLFDIFSKAGNVLFVKLCTTSKQKSGDSPWLCHAYVNFNTVEEACIAWQTLNYKDLNGRAMRILFSNLDPTSRYNKNANLIIKNLEESIDSKALHHTFLAIGVVLSSKVQQDRDGKSLGYGFIQFQDKEDAQRAISLANGMLLEGKQVYLGPFIPRSTNCIEATMNLNPMDLNPAYNTTTVPQPTNLTSHLLGERSAMLGDSKLMVLREILDKVPVVPSPLQASALEIHHTNISAKAPVAPLLPFQKGTGFFDVLGTYHKVHVGKEGKVQGTGYFDVSRTQLPNQLVSIPKDQGEAEVEASTSFFDVSLAQLFSTSVNQDEAEAQDAQDAE